MAAKAIVIVCAQALLVQLAFAQYGPYIGSSCGCTSFTPSASSGGNFVVTSASPVAPTGVSVVSENVYEGSLVLGGNLPLLGSVALEGEFPTAGAGAVSYGCGDGVVEITTEEGPIVTGIAAPAYTVPAISAVGPAFGAFGLGYGAPFGLGFNRGYGLGYGRLGITPFGRGYGFGIGAIF